MRRFLLVVIPVIALVLWAACSPVDPPPEPLPTRIALEAMVPVGARVTPEFATATPWPTFTPLPTATPSYTSILPMLEFPPRMSAQPTPVARPPTPTPAPTLSGPLPTPVIESFNLASALATPTPALVQRNVHGLDLTLARQSVFMSHVERPPDLFPSPRTVFYTRTARYIGWWVDFDYTASSDDFEMAGLLRLLNVTTGELVMYQEPFVLQHGHGLFIMLGDSVPGRLWFPGRYRFEAWDNRDRVMVHYDFEVRSGLLH